MRFGGDLYDCLRISSSRRPAQKAEDEMMDEDGLGLIGLGNAAYADLPLRPAERAVSLTPPLVSIARSSLTVRGARACRGRTAGQRFPQH